MFGLQPLHLLAIVVIALLVFGPGRFANLGRSIRKAFSEARSAAQEKSRNAPADAKASAPQKRAPK